MRSVLQDWVMDLPLREQGVLLTGVRGCDVAPKRPYASPERQLTAYLRYCFMVPADPREVGIAGAFFQNQPPGGWAQSDLGHYPVHWYSHIMHAYQVVWVRHPNVSTKLQARTIYYKLVRGLHLMPENPDQMIERLSEDRIASDTVVS